MTTSDTPTAAEALAAALRTKTNYFFAPEAMRAQLAAELLAALTAAGWSLVPSGSLLDMARAVVALADRVTETQKPAPESRLWLNRQQEANLRGWNDAVVSILRWIGEGEHAATIAAAREMVAAEPGT